MPHITLNLLGSFQVTRDARPVMAFASDEVRALLGWLAVTSSAPHPRSDVSELLWPGLDEETADKSLHQALGNLHQVLGDYANDQPVILTDNGTVQFNPQSDCRVDVLAFREALDDVSAHLHSNGDLCEDCYHHLLQAEQLYRGDFLSNLAIESESFESWTTVQRETLHLQMLDVLQYLADYASQHGETAVAQRYSRRQVDLEPWWEVAHRELVRNLTHGTQRGWSLAPSDAILPARDKMERGSPEPYSGEIPTPTPNNITPQLTPFIGRADLLAQVEASIVDTDCHLLTLLGAGGSGKTRLAQEAAQHLVDSHDHTFTDGIYWVELASLSAIEGIVPAIAQAIGHTFSGQLDPQEELFNVLRNKFMLLVLDNFEHLLEGAALIVELLQKAPNVKVVTTTRVKLNASSEQVLLVPGMAYPDAPVPTEQASDYGAIQLFSHFAQQLLPGFAIDEGNVEAVVRICDAVCGMPLGILLASSWMAILAPAEIADEIEHSLDFLTTDWLEVPARQRSMRAVFEHTWNLLPAKEQRMLASLAVFKGGWTREAALEVAQVTLRDLLTLINKCLVQRTPNGRYGMHELLRQFAEDKLSENPELEYHAHQTHAEYYSSKLSDWYEGLHSLKFINASDEIDANLKNARSATDWLLDNQQFDGIDDCLSCMSYYFRTKGLLRDGVAYFLAIAERFDTLKRDAAGLVSANAYIHYSLIQRVMGKTRAAIEASERSLQYFGLTYEKALQLSYKDLPTSAHERSILSGILFVVAGIHADADSVRIRHLYALCYRIAKTYGSVWREACTLDQLVDVYIRAYQRELARKIFDKTQALFQEAQDPVMLIHNLMTSANWFYSYGDVEIGESDLQRAEHLASIYGLKLGFQFRWLKSSILNSLGKYKECLQIRLQLEQEASELGLRNRIQLINIGIAKVYTQLGKYKSAMRIAKAAYDYYVSIQADMNAMKCLVHLFTISLGAGRPQQALIYYQKFADLSDSLGLGHSVMHDFLPYILFQLDRYGEMGEPVLSYLTRTLHTRDLIDLFCVLPMVSLTLLATHQTQRAIEVYALAYSHDYVSNNVWLEDVAGKFVKQAAADLPPDVVAAAEARGRELDLWETAEALVTELEKLNATHNA